MYLRDLAVYADEAIVDQFKGGFVHRFHRESLCVVDFYSREIQGKIKTPDTGKVVFQFSDRINKPEDLGPPLPTSNLWWPFDFASYASASDGEKKRRILDALHEALLWAGKIEGWDVEPMHAAYAAIVSHDCNYRSFSKKSWVSPNRRFRVKVYFEYELDGLNLFAVLFPARRPIELTRHFLAKAIPSDAWVDEYLSHGKWTSNSRFELRTSPSAFIQKKWTADFSDVIGGSTSHRF